MIIKLEEYNPAWKKDFELEKNKLNKILLPTNVQIEHIGSTSIEGSVTKPIIDILIGVDSPTLFDSIVMTLIKNNYIYYSVYNHKYPDRRHLIKIKENIDIKEITNFGEDIIDNIGYTRLFHVNVTVHKSKYWNRHIGFRDSLRLDSKLLFKYSKLKIELAKLDWPSMENYSDAKTEFIREVEKVFINRNF